MRRGLFFIVFLFLLQAIFSQEQKQLVVVSTEDDVVNPAKGSLRWACMQATEDVSVSITFSFSEIGPKVIKLKDELSINGEVRIDGSSYVDSVIIDGMDVVRNFYLPSSFSKLELNNLKLQGPLCVEASKNSILKIENSDIEQIACIACSCDIDNSVLRGTLNFVSEGIFHVENCKFENGASVACPGNPSEELILSKNLLLGDYTVSSSYGPLFVTRTFQVSKPHIDTAYVQYGEIFIEGHVDSLEVVDVELFVSKYDTYKAEKYLGAVKTKSDGSFVYRGELDSSLINGETISISATATYDEKLTSEYSSYAIDGHYWIVTNTNSTGEGTLKWACQNATQNDTIIFLFNEPGNKVIKSDGEFVLGASVDGSSFPDSIIIKPGFSLKNRVPVIKDIVIEGNKKNYGIVGAVSSSNVPDLIENCVIRNCSVGVHGANKIVRCQILNNKIGVYSSPHGAFVQRISDCVVSGNDSIGIDGDYYCIENCIIGLTPDQKHPMPNGIGIMGETRYNNLDTLKNNVISGNRYDGIVIGNRAHVRVFEGNLVGTNKYFDLNSDLGNGGSGLVMTGNSSVNFFFNNYFVNNKEYGVRNSTNSSLTINSSYFGVDKSANPMPNKLAGIYTDVYSELNLKNCSISNNGDGIKRETVIGQTTLDSCVFDNNSGFGVSINLTQYSGGLEITNSKFSSNGKSAVSLAGILPPTYKFSNNLFENTQRKSDSSQALDLGISLPIPQLTTISYEDGQFTIIGKVDTMSKANIELYYTNGELQTAHKFLKSDSTSVEGDFSFTILEDEISESGKIYFSATATYGRRTSQLSEPFSCNSCCTIDTIIAPVDTVFYGEKFLDKVYAIGRHDSIFETIALPNGCDSVVMHTLIVKPDPTKLNYYVKTERWGAGDGSSWENAMDGDDFIFMLPQVGDGVTFHVAEGRYVKEGNALSNKINSSVKIIGGYEAEAKTGAVSDPKKYHTVFESLPDKYGYGFSNLCFYELTNTESVVELSNLDLSHSGVKGKAGKLVVDSCSFYDCYLTLDISVDTLIVSNSYFGKILEEARLYNGINHIRQQGKFASISACTFEGNSSSSLGIRMIDISASGAAHIENCTFANLYNRSTGYQITLASSNDTVFFVNNTIVGNIHQSSFSFTNVAFIGNIIAGSSSSLKDGKILKSEYNLVGEGSSLSNSDKDVNSSDLVEILNGTYDASTGLFTPVLADNGGFTPTVALKSDRLPDGTSIRFPLSETTVATDQRSVERLEQTCMGAYELECTADTTRTTDTIVVGEKFLDKVYAIGRHDSIFETIALPNGCDSVVMHTLIVKPDPTKLNYYVKTERWGAGDGSSWENAMDGDDFIFMLPQVGDGVTFHVAEGRYVKEGNALSNKINSSVKIIGGYEAEAKTGAVSDPKKYHTVFESLPDKYGYGFSNLCFYELTNTESVVELSNLDLSHSGVKGKAGKLVVDSCSFYDCYLTLDISVDTLIVSNSYFGKILEEARLYNGINHIRQQGKFASISACTFEGNSSSSLGIRMIDISASGAAHIENCTFANLYNRSTGYQITLASSNDTVFFVNNTIVGNIHQSSFSFTNVAFIGNIIAGSSSSLKDGKILKSEYNLVGEGSSLSNSDKDVNSSDLVEILNGTYDASTGLFTPVLADNGGFTPTVALKSDRLPDGTSIRFPLSETTVATDQRGVERFPLTCMGAYELEYDTSDCEIGTIIFKEDFGGNYRSDPDFGPALPNGLTTLEYGDNLVPYNGYSLRKEALKRNITNCSDFSNVNKHIYCGWYADFDDHTSEGDFDRGYFMQIDMDRNKTIFYTITINDLCEHTHLNLMMWVHPVNSKADSELILSVEDLSGNVLASEAFVVESSVNEWSKISIPFTVPLNQTSIVYKIYSEADSYGGDIAIDDIEVRLCKPAVSVNAPEDYLCATSDYKLTATYGNKGGYIEPVNYTWFTNSEPSYEIEGWTKVSEGKELQLENISSDAYYRCVISSAGVEGVFDKCNSASDIIPVLLGELNDTSFVADTILTGEIYNGNQYFEVGTFDGIVETIHRDGTCDSIVLHELHVVREDFCSLATLSSNPITKSSDYLQFTSSYPRDLKFTIMDKEGNIVCKTVERTYGAGEHKVSLFKLFGIDKRDFDPLTPYILVVSSGNDLFMTYIYISWM